LFHAFTAEASVCGGVASMRTVGLSAVRTFPAASDTEAVALRFWPSPLIRPSAGQSPSIPASASSHVQWMATSLVYQPSSPAVPPATSPRSAGAVLSIRTGPTVVAAELSALSTADAVTVWSPPSLERTLVPCPVQLLIPESASEQSRLTVTSLLFQPLAFGCGLRDAPIVGAVLSSLRATEPEPALPTRSAADAVRTTLAVSAVTESLAGVGPAATPEPASVADHLTPTSALCQPAPFATGETAPLTCGPVLSSTYDACRVPCCPWHLFWLSLKFFEAVTVTVLTPSPAPAVNVKDQAVFPGGEVWRPVCAPVSSTHSTSSDVLTVSVSAPPCFA
jgi:hypothetical protein